MSFTLNPSTVTNAKGLFYTQSVGFLQGAMEDDPATRYQLQSALVGTAATLYGGLAVTSVLPAAASAATEFRSVLLRATAAWGSGSGIMGFAVFNQSAGLLQTPQSPVPSAQANMGINWAAFYSGIRVAVQCSQADASAMANGSNFPTLYWNTTTLMVTLTSGGAIALPTTVELVDLDVIGNSLVCSSDTNLTWGAGYCAVLKL